MNYLPNAELIDLVPTKTYASKGNAIAAVDKIYNKSVAEGVAAKRKLKFLVLRDEANRWYPVFIGEYAIVWGVFHNFHVVN